MAGGGAADAASPAWRERFDVLLARAQPILLGLARKNLGSVLRQRCEPGDVLQETARRVLAAGPQGILDDETVFIRYVATTAQRVVRDLYDFHVRERRDAERECAADSGIAAPSTQGPIRVSLRQERAASVRSALGSLPVRDRQIVEAHNEGASPAEIAARLGLSDSAIRKRLGIIFARLARALKWIDSLGDDATGRRTAGPAP